MKLPRGISELRTGERTKASFRGRLKWRSVFAVIKLYSFSIATFAGVVVFVAVFIVLSVVVVMVDFIALSSKEVKLF